jgi:hypothetical protein
MQAACLAITNSGESQQKGNTLIRAENRAGQLLAELAKTTPAEVGISVPMLAAQKKPSTEAG